MFQAHDPMQASAQALLGDEVFGIGQGPHAVTLPSADDPRRIDYLTDRVVDLAARLIVLEQRVESLEAQTPAAYWVRFLAWVRGWWR